MTKQVCIWTYDDMADCWDTGCGEAFALNEGGPSENNMRYCPFCGLRLEAKKHD